MRDLEDKLNSETELSERLRGDKLRADMELGRLGIEAEKDKVLMDRSMTGLQVSRRNIFIINFSCFVFFPFFFVVLYLTHLPPLSFHLSLLQNIIYYYFK